MKEKPSWVPGAQFPVDAQVAADTICDLKKSLGKETITAKELLDASRDESAPLHSCFEWDDTVAAEQYRTWQALHLINSLRVTIINEDREPITVRGLVNINSVAPKKQGEFVSFQRAMEVAEYRQQVLKNALLELRAFQRKYTLYEELNCIFKAIDEYDNIINSK